MTRLTTTTKTGARTDGCGMPTSLLVILSWIEYDVRPHGEPTGYSIYALETPRTPSPCRDHITRHDRDERQK
jgi:hypothetical protein